LQQQHPELVVSEMAKHQRRERVLIDWSQNSMSRIANDKDAQWQSRWREKPVDSQEL